MAVPVLADATDLLAADAVLVGRFGHLGLTQETWPTIGRLDDWDRTAWPMPVLVRHEELSGRSYRVFYEDDDPGNLIREEQVPAGGDDHGPKDGLMGAGYVERMLTGMLD